MSQGHQSHSPIINCFAFFFFFSKLQNPVFNWKDVIPKKWLNNNATGAKYEGMW